MWWYIVDRETGNLRKISCVSCPTENNMYQGRPVKTFTNEVDAEEYAESRKNSNGGSASIGTGAENPLLYKIVFLLILIPCIYFIWKWGISNFLGKTSGYITTKQNILEYEKIEKIPLDKQIGKIPADTVLKLKRVSKKGTITWIWCYKLKNGEPIETYILLPEALGRRKIEKGNKYVIYNDNSRTWKTYYEKIDAENKALEKRFAQQFKEKVKDIKIQSSKDNVLRESIQNTCFIFPKEGYFNLYTTKDETFFYIDKNEKQKFLKIYNELKNNFDKEKKVYFPKNRGII